MFCEQCGKQMQDESLFCSNCGNKNSSKVEETKPARDPIPVFVPDPVEAPAYVIEPVAIPEEKPELKQNVKKEIVQKDKPAPQQKVEKEILPEDLTKPMSVMGYIGTFLLLSIPILNIILLFVWAFGKNVNKNKKNLAIAGLLLTVIYIVLGIIFGATVLVLISDLIYDMM
ncbi:MAG: hypothetical protein CVV02_01430 [Firmicutes bacterium HGW-Firmicutes-7]|nr:MAG: hypothetical protein CVV02_01430 [Firmicutes bacterium HGW-Firmicutes-7]